MLMTQEELKKYMYDPNKLQQVMLENLESATNGKYVITEPTNPFVMLMELAVTSGANAITEPLGVVRQLYPNLAEAHSELYHHISDSDVKTLFATPAEVPMVMYVNVKDLYSNGSESADGIYVETVIPIGTEITVNSIIFTLLNNIVVRLYKEGGVFVEQQTNPDLDISVKNLGVLSSGIVNFTNGEPWIVFETLVKQVKKSTINKAITPSEGFDITTSVTNKYSYSNITYKNNRTNNVYTKLNKSHSKAYIDRTTPTCYIEVTGKDVRYKIPDVYLVDGVVSGNIKIDIYETMGKIYLPINKFDMADYAVSIKPLGTTKAEASIANIAVLANSRAVLDGGKDSVTISELKNNIITNSVGSIDVPVTDANIIQRGLLEGFDVTKAMDILTDRVYIASKNLPELNITNIHSRPDIYFNTVGILIDSVPRTSKVIVSGNYLIIKAGCVFKELNNVVNIVDDVELNRMGTLAIDSLINITKTTKYFYTPYFYVIDTSNDTEIRSSVYKLDKPYLENVIIKAKNPNILPKVNLDKYTVELDETGYSLYFSLISNNEFKDTNLNVVKGQLGIYISGSNEKLYIESTYDSVNNLLIFHIDTELILDSNESLTVNNGVSALSSNKISLVSDVEVLLYTLDSNVVDNTNFLATELRYNTDTHTVVFGKEVVTLNLGNKVNNIWNMLYNTYTENKYLKYTENVIQYYEEDVYEVDAGTGSILKCETDIDGNIIPTYNILHHAGDPVLDINGDVVYKHKIGDVVLKNSVPVIDKISGIIRNIDIMMLDYEYKLANSPAHKNYINTVIDTIDSWINGSISDIGNVLLENTTLLYKSYKKAGMIGITSNNKTYSVNYNIKPIVTLYVNNKAYTNNELLTLTYTIGNILHDTINKESVDLTIAKSNIMTAIGSDVVGVKITGVDSVNDSELFNMYDSSKRLVLNKLLTIDDSNNIIVKYDIDIKIISI